MKFKTNKTNKKPEFNVPNLTKALDFKKPEAALKKSGKRLITPKHYAYGLLIILIVLVNVTLYFIIQEYIDTHTFKLQSPILVKVQTPLVIQRRKDLFVSPLSKKSLNVTQVNAQSMDQIPDWKIIPDNVDKKKWEYITEQSDARLVLYIWGKESNYGRDVVQGSLDQYCRTIGKYNETGEGGMQDMTCYDTFDANIQATIKSLDSYGKMSEKEKLCYYNVGEKTDTCSYVSGWK